MATIHTMKEIPETFECLAWQLIKLLLSGYNCVDIVPDSYSETFYQVYGKKRSRRSK